jgi:hypothetical protein
LSLGDCFEKSCFHIVLDAFLGLIKKISSVFFILRHTEDPAQGRYTLLYSQSVFRDPSGGRGRGERTPYCREFKNRQLKSVFLGKYSDDFYLKIFLESA